MTAYKNRVDVVGMWAPNIGKITHYENNVNSTVAQYDVRSLQKTHGYFRLKASGVALPVLAYDRKIIEGEIHSHVDYEGINKYPYPQLNNGNKYKNGQFHVVGTPKTWSTFLAINSAKKTGLVNEAKAKFQNNIENIIVEAPTEIAEIHKTAGMVLNRVKDLEKFASTFIRGKAKLRSEALKLMKRYTAAGTRPKGFTRLVDDLNGMYLEYNYGWKPLMSLFNDAGKLIVERTDSHVARIKVSGHSWSQDQISSNFATNQTFTAGSATIADLGQFEKRLLMEWRHDVWVGGLLAGVSHRDDLKQQLGLNASNIIPTLWELTYLSFIVDYFVNIGDWLGNLRNSVSQMNATTLYLSQKTVATEYWDLKALKTPDTHLRSPYTVRYDCKVQPHVDSVCKYVWFNRVPLSAPQTKVELSLLSPSWRQVFNTISVARQMTTKPRELLRLT